MFVELLNTLKTHDNFLIPEIFLKIIKIPKRFLISIPKTPDMFKEN
jgi:hypothetical protein